MSRAFRDIWPNSRLMRAMTFFLAIASVAAGAEGTAVSLAPGAMAASADGQRLFIACAAANQVLVIDARRAVVTRIINVPGPPSGLALSSDSRRLYVTCASPESTVAVIDTASGRLQNKLRAGHTAMAPLLGPTGRTLYVCNRFDNDVCVIALPGGRQIARIAVSREPVADALTPDGHWLLVANHLQTGRADVPNVAAAVSVIDTSANRVAKTIVLPNGSGLLRGVAVSPDGRLAAVTHVLSYNYLPTTQVDRGWMNCNALTLLDLSRLETVGTVLLDEVDRGAANPWAVAWTADGRRLLVTHAGTDELSVIEAPALIKKLAGMTTAQESADDLAFLVGIRRRVALPLKGARALAVSGTRAYVAGYNLVAVDLTAPTPGLTSIPISAPSAPSSIRRGEMLFNDAGLCFQEWQSCASCHSSDGRVDGKNWDLLNDGIGNPKNTHSLLLSHRTPPAMSESVRDTAEEAVRAGIRHVLFSTQPEEVADAVDDYLKSLTPVPSPHLVRGRLSASAQRGKLLFEDARVGCADCHPPGLFTSLQSYDVGTRSAWDHTSAFDTPSLIEVWRTAPYLHDGSAATVNDVLTTHNSHDQHGRTSHLTPKELADLADYLLSL
jgi:YVTN family beta-propeller protein